MKEILNLLEENTTLIYPCISGFTLNPTARKKLLELGWIESGIISISKGDFLRFKSNEDVFKYCDVPLTDELRDKFWQNRKHECLNKPKFSMTKPLTDKELDGLIMDNWVKTGGSLD